MVPIVSAIVLSYAVWDKLLSKQRLKFRCDNHSLVDAITKGSSKEEMVMHLLRNLWFFTAVFDIEITASHIPGVQNTAADLLSRNQLERFLVMNPLASKKPTPIGPLLAVLISPTQPDWTSASFQHNVLEVFQTVLN